MNLNEQQMYNYTHQQIIEHLNKINKYLTNNSLDPSQHHSLLSIVKYMNQQLMMVSVPQILDNFTLIPDIMNEIKKGDKLDHKMNAIFNTINESQQQLEYKIQQQSSSHLDDNKKQAINQMIQDVINYDKE